MCAIILKTESVTGSYRCQKKAVGACTTTSMSHAKVERAFEEYIARYEELDVADEIEIQSQKKQENLAQIKAYQEKLHLLETKEREVMKLYVDDGLDLAGYREIKNIADKEKSVISAELERLQATQNEGAQLNKTDIINDFRENWARLSASERRQFLLRFIGKITVKSERKEGEHFSTVKILDIDVLPSHEKHRNVKTPLR